MVNESPDPPLNPSKARRSSGRPWESLWEGLEELWESSGRLWESLWEGLEELWESFGRLWRSSGIQRWIQRLGGTPHRGEYPTLGGNHFMNN